MNADPSPTALQPDDAPVRYGSGMLRRFGWFYWLIGLGWATGRVRMEDHAVDHVRGAAAEGPIVYVMIQSSTLDLLALNTVLNRRRLPLAVWANGVFTTVWQPVAAFWRDMGRRAIARYTSGPAPEPVGSGWLADRIAGGDTVAIFLGHRRSLRERFGGAPMGDPIESILAAQERSQRPVQLLPVMVVWNRSPETPHNELRGWLLGSRERPSLTSRLRNLYFPPGQGPFVQIGKPLDLQEFVRRANPETRKTTLRVLLRRFLRRESNVVRGPHLLARDDIKQIVLDNPPMREFAQQEATASNRSVEAVRADMVKEFNAIAANFKWGIIRFLSISMKPIWNGVFSGYDIREEDLERIRTAMRDGSAVIVPCHKSHFDYLLLSWIFYYNDVVVPHVVAGLNLAIWPISVVLRGCGGFFIKRSFAGENVHAAVFSRYLRELLRQGYTVEFFIEGGRTRTGRMLPARPGVLGMVLDAAARGTESHEITLLPMSITYEQVAEAASYEKEMGGADKRKESVGQLLKASSVFSRRFGRVYVRVGEPIKASTVVRGETQWLEADAAARAAITSKVGDRIVQRIGSVAVVLPTSLVALALLAHHRQGILHGDLTARTERFRAFLVRNGALESELLDRHDQAITQALDRFVRLGFVRMHEQADRRIWGVVPDSRLNLDFHKNQVLHLFTEAMYAAAAFRPLGDRQVKPEELLPTTTFLERLLRRELPVDPDLSPEGRLERGLAALVAHGALAEDGGAYKVTDPARIGEIHGLLRSIPEAYLLVLRSSDRLKEASLDRDSFVKALLADREALLTSGAISRPEALAAPTLKHAISTMCEEGALIRNADRLTVAPGATADELVAQLSPLVD